jgi:hypothetical protein
VLVVGAVAWAVLGWRGRRRAALRNEVDVAS